MITSLRYYIDTAECFDPHRNLALEQYLTEAVGEEECILYLWQNRHTVVIGRNQNAWQECRTTDLERDGGHLARRLSGGGAVYHDLGNLNFTFCVRSENYDLARQQRVLLEACRLVGIEAELSGRNDLLAGGRKFSGNSFYSHAGHSFHNGTLLVDVDMANLGKYLNPSKAKLSAKGVASVRSRVVNLRELQPTLTIDSMAEAMLSAFEQVYGLSAAPIRPRELDAEKLDALYAQFSAYDWIYGKSVAFDFSCAERFDWGEITLQFAVQEGLVRECAVYSDALDTAFAAVLSDALRGQRFTVDSLCARIAALPALSDKFPDLCALIRAQDI